MVFMTMLVYKLVLFPTRLCNGKGRASAHESENAGIVKRRRGRGGRRKEKRNKIGEEEKRRVECAAIIGAHLIS